MLTLSPRLKWITFALVFFGIVISYIDRGNLSIAASSVMRDLGLPPARMGLLLSVFFWTYGIFQIPAGFLIDRFGIRIVYAIAFTIWSLASGSIALSRGPADITASRLVLGFAESVGPLASLSFIRRYFESAERGLPTALYIGGQTLGPAVGSLLGAMVLTHLGWRALFAITGLGALAWVPLWLWVAPRGRQTVEPASKTVPISNLFAGPAVWALASTIFFASYFWWFVMTWMPGYLTLSRGLSTTSMGRIFSIPLFTMTITNLLAGKWSDYLVARTGQGIRIRVGFGALGLLGASTSLLLNIPTIPLLPVLLVCICGFGIASASMWTIAQGLVPSEIVGRFVGFMNTISQFAGVAAPLITGWTVGSGNNFELAIWIAGLAPLLAAASLIAISVQPTTTI